MKFLLALVMLISAQLAFSNDCSQFMGKYTISEYQDGCPESLKFSYLPGSNVLIIGFNTNMGGGWTASYIADSKPHAGDDMNTGIEYSAACEGKRLVLRQRFSALKHILLRDFQMTSEGLELNTSFESTSFNQACAYNKN